VVNRLVVAFCLLATAASAQPARPQDPGPPVVVTTGDATIKRAPDRAWVAVAAESRARTPREAQKANAAAMSAVMQMMKGAGLPADAIRTMAYDLQPEFDYRDGRQTLRGYVARNAIDVRVDQIDRLGEILELAVGAGATNVSGVRFDLKDRASAEREALAGAVADARGRADAAAKAAGMTIERVLRIEEERQFGGPEPVMHRQTLTVEAAAPVVPITPGEIEIRVVVTLTAAVR
jgi:uncharacterized protein